MDRVWHRRPTLRPSVLAAAEVRRKHMNPLIGTIAAAVLAMSALTVAATGQGATGKAGDGARAKANASGKARTAKGDRRGVSTPGRGGRAVMRGPRGEVRFDS